jgi:hypothetical protein
MSLLEETIPLDLENMMNNPDGYVPVMTEDNHDVAVGVYTYLTWTDLVEG